MPKRRSVLISAGLLLVAIIATSCLTSTEPELVKISPEVEQEVIRIANQDAKVQSFTATEPDYRREIIILEPETIAKLSQTQPVIYGGLPSKVLYKIDYKSNGKGILVIVDLEEGRVLKYFRTVGVSLE